MNRVSDAVSCGARNVRDDSDIVAGQSIHKRALANVRSAGENNRETLSKNLTSHSCILQLHELLRDCCHAFIDVTAFNKVYFLFWEINGGFNVGTQFQKIRVDFVNAFRKLSLQGPGGGTYGRTRIGFNQVGHGFGLRQIHAIVQEGALGEFAGLGRTKTDLASCLKTAFQNNLLQGRTAVRLNLKDVLSGIGSRAEVTDDNSAVNQMPVGILEG